MWKPRVGIWSRFWNKRKSNFDGGAYDEGCVVLGQRRCHGDMLCADGKQPSNASIVKHFRSFSGSLGELLSQGEAVVRDRDAVVLWLA